MALPRAPPMLPCKPLYKLCIYRVCISPGKPCSCCTETAWNSGHFNKGNSSLKQPSHLKFLETLKRGIYEAKIKETCWHGELETYQSSSLIPSNQVNTTQHRNNIRQLSDCLKFSFDIWRKNMINSELELTYGKLFHPLHLGTHHNPNLSKQKIKFSFWTTLMQAQDTQTGSSLSFFSRGYTA